MSGWMAVVFGVVLVGAGAYGVNETLRYQRSGVHASGTVVGVKSRLEIDDDGVSVMQRPIVEFVPEGGRQPVRFTSSTATSWPWSHRQGDRVDVIYLREDPSHARIDGALVRWIGPLVLIVIGAWVVIKRPTLSRDRSTSIGLD